MNEPAQSGDAAPHGTDRRSDSGPDPEEVLTRMRQEGYADPRDLLGFLGSLGIDYETHEHDPVYTVEESAHLYAILPGAHCKTLFLRDKKKNMALVVARDDTQVDLKSLAAKLGLGRFSFGSGERLWETLGVTPGSVTPFALVNEARRGVPEGTAEPALRNVVLDSSLFDEDRPGRGLVNFHPLINTQTSRITADDLIKFIRACGYEPECLDLE